MERKIYQDLLNWKTNQNRKPLILQGARQVGKTYIVNLFAGKEYNNSVYCNFEKDSKLKDFFIDLNPTNILQKLSLYKRKEIFEDNTLIIFDEIQACPEALTSLKYFYEEKPNYHIIALGSLLGVAVNRNDFSFPVGKVQLLTLYPMDFEEFLMANNEQELIELIKNSYNNNSPLDLAFHERALTYYKDYLFIGGMPEVVDEYIKNHNLDYVRIMQQDIFEAYQNDMSKYNKQTDIPKTKIIYNNISTQLSKENKKFQYSYVKKGARAKEFEEAIEWITLSGIAAKLYRIEKIMLPLAAYKSISDFKFFINDVGLLGASLNINYNDIFFENPLINNFKGGLVENYVFNELIKNKHELFYWTSNSEAEVDFILRLSNDIIPIEVKSSTNTRSKSLNIYIEKYNPSFSIRISQKNFGFENNIKSVPLYAVFCIK